MIPRIDRRSLLSGVATAAVALAVPRTRAEEVQESRTPRPPGRPRHEITATFSIVAVDPDLQICGAAVASMYPAVGKVVPYVRANAGAFCTQHYHVPRWGDQVLEKLQQGRRPQSILAELVSEDPEADQRQLAIIDRDGRVASQNPTGAGTDSRYWASLSGRFYSCQGNTLTGRRVVTAMAEAYEETQGSLADRLVAALIAADCAGGDHRGRLAAGIRLARTGVDGHWLALDVDRHEDAVIELARQYVLLDHPAKGGWSGGKKPFEHPCPNRAAPRQPTP